MNQVWFGEEDKTAFWEAISRRIDADLISFVARQVDFRFTDEEFYNLLSTDYLTPEHTELRLVLGVDTEDLEEEDSIPVGITIITRPFRIFEIVAPLPAVPVPPAAPSNYDRLILIPDSYVLNFTSDTSAIDYWDFSPSEGVDLQHFPAGMFSDTSIFWIERIRVSAGDALSIHRGGSLVDATDFFPALPATSVVVLINEDDETWLIIDAQSTTLTNGAATYTESDRDIIASELGSMQLNPWLQSLASKELVCAITPDRTFRPEF